MADLERQPMSTLPAEPRPVVPNCLKQAHILQDTVDLQIVDLLKHQDSLLRPTEKLNEGMVTVFTDKNSKITESVTGSVEDKITPAEAGTKNNKQKGIVPSDETRMKMSEAHKGRIHSDETRQRIGESQRGRTLSAETREKISAAKKGKTFSEDARARLSEAHKGIVCSDETRLRRSESQKGKTHSAETRQKLSKARKKENLSDETRRRLSEAARRREIENGNTASIYIEPLLQRGLTNKEIIKILGAEFTSRDITKISYRLWKSGRIKEDLREQLLLANQQAKTDKNPDSPTPEETSMRKFANDLVRSGMIPSETTYREKLLNYYLKTGRTFPESKAQQLQLEILLIAAEKNSAGDSTVLESYIRLAEGENLKPFKDFLHEESAFLLQAAGWHQERSVEANDIQNNQITLSDGDRKLLDLLSPNEKELMRLVGSGIESEIEKIAERLEMTVEEINDLVRKVLLKGRNTPQGKQIFEEDHQAHTLEAEVLGESRVASMEDEVSNNLSVHVNPQKNRIIANLSEERLAARRRRTERKLSNKNENDAESLKKYYGASGVVTWEIVGEMQVNMEEDLKAKLRGMLKSDPELISDFLHEAALQMIASYEGKYIQNLGGLYLRVAQNKVLDYLRREGRRPKKQSYEDMRSEQTSDTGNIVPEIIIFEQEDSLESQIIREETICEVDRALLTLNNLTRQEAIRKRFEGWSYQEIADDLGISIGTVKSTINRGLTELRNDERLLLYQKSA